MFTKGIRGAITVEENSSEAIGSATIKLLQEIVKVNNVDELMAQPHIDGALIGGASLDPENFIYFTNAAVNSIK